MKTLPQNWRIIFTILVLLVVVFLVYVFRSIVAYVIIAIIISFICEPVSRLLKKVRMGKFYIPDWFRALMALGIFVVVFSGIFILLTPLVKDEISIISQIDPVSISDKIQQQLYGWQAASEYAGDIKLTEFFISSAQSFFSFEWFKAVFNNIFGFVGNVLVGLFAVLFISFFVLKDGFLFSRVVFILTPDQHLEKVKRIMKHSHNLLGRYFLGVALQSLIMALIVGISLSILGVHNSLLIGLFAGLINVIPYIGPWIGAIVGVLIALTTSIHLDFQAASLPLLLRVLAVFGAAHLIDNLLVQPILIGNRVKAHPLEIFIVVLMSATVAGIIGMVLAVPAYTILRVVAREFMSEFKAVESLTRNLSGKE